MDSSPKPSLHITEPLRIVRLLRKLCQARLSVLLRVHSNLAVAARGTMAGFELFQNSSQEEAVAQGLFIHGLSDKAMEHLRGHKDIHFQCVMSSAKLEWDGEIKTLERFSVLTQLPKKICSFERRKDARQTCHEGMMSFVSLSLLDRSLGLDAVPCFLPYQEMASMLPLMDISLGGLCLTSPFPWGRDILTKDTVDLRSYLHLPREMPLAAPVRVQWVKMIKEHQRESSGFVATTYRYGCAWHKPSDALIAAIKRYMQQLVSSDAI